MQIEDIESEVYAKFAGIITCHMLFASFHICFMRGVTSLL